MWKQLLVMRSEKVIKEEIHWKIILHSEERIKCLKKRKLL